MTRRQIHRVIFHRFFPFLLASMHHYSAAGDETAARVVDYLDGAYRVRVLHTVSLIFTSEIVQCLLGVLISQSNTPQSLSSSEVSKGLWDSGKAILTPVAIYPNSTSLSPMSTSVLCS